jgi:hypothetical protein
MLLDSGYESCYGELEDRELLKDPKGKGKAVEMGLSSAQGNEPLGEASDGESKSIQTAEAGPATVAVDERKPGIDRKRKHKQGDIEKDIKLAPKRSRVHTQDKLRPVEEGRRRSQRLHKTYKSIARTNISNFRNERKVH